MVLIKWIQNRKWITLGMKLLVGVALASNIFIGSLLYFNLNSSKLVEQTMNQVIDIRQKLSSNLRVAVVELQNKFLSLPQFFQIDPRAQITETINREFKVVDKQILEGRDAYVTHFSRNERRDLAKKEFVVKVENNFITVSSGIFDESGNFKDSVEYLSLTCDDVESGAKRLKTVIKELNEGTNNPQFLKQKVSELGSMVADTALKAEKTRNEILSHVEQINTIEHKLSETRSRQRKFTVIMGGIAIIANMLVLFILVRIIVEQPLRQLTNTIDEIRAGKSPDIPWHNRRDQIGVLSGAIINFSEALSRIRDENDRKQQECVIIDEVFDMINSVVQTLEHRAKELVTCADTLHTLATNTGRQSECVSLRASATALHTEEVSRSTSHLQAVVENITSQIIAQNGIVGVIIDKNSQSHANITQLNQSIYDINDIISVIREIADQTKLLALNASIEAARAGTKGQGFAVVAGEIKELSTKTQLATRDVMEKVSAIEKASFAFVGNLDDIDKRVHDLNTVTTNIMKAVDEQKQLTDSIANLTTQTSENTRDVSSSIEEVSSAASRTRTLSQQVHNYSDEIANQLTDLLGESSSKLSKLTRITGSDTALSRAA